MAARRRTYLSSQERRAEIIEVAFRCVQDFGYAKLTARRIAAVSGISLGHITYHFKDMNEVAAETYRLASSKLLEATRKNLEAAPQDSIEQLKAFLRTGFTPDFLRKDYLRVRVDLWAAALSQPEIAETERSLYERYRQQLCDILLRVAKTRGRNADDIAALADAIMAMLDGLWLDWERRKNGTAIENGLAACILLVDMRFAPTEHSEQCPRDAPVQATVPDNIDANGHL